MSSEQAMQAMAGMQQQLAVVQARISKPRIKSQDRSKLLCTPSKSRRPTLGDNKDLGRAQAFSGDETQFQRWSPRAESVFSQMHKKTSGMGG